MGPIRLNNYVFSRNSVAVRLNGLDRLTGVESINWSDEVPVELVPGLNDQGIPLGKVSGNYTCAADISLYEDEAQLFEQKLALLDPTALGNLAKINFQLPISYREDVRIGTAMIVNCSIKNREWSVSTDGSALVRKFTLQPQVVLSNGFSLCNLIPAV